MLGKRHQAMNKTAPASFGSAFLPLPVPLWGWGCPPVGGEEEDAVFIFLPRKIALGRLPRARSGSCLSPAGLLSSLCSAETGRGLCHASAALIEPQMRFPSPRCD